MHWPCFRSVGVSMLKFDAVPEMTEQVFKVNKYFIVAFFFKNTIEVDVFFFGIQFCTHVGH